MYFDINLISSLDRTVDFQYVETRLFGESLVVFQPLLPEVQ